MLVYIIHDVVIVLSEMLWVYVRKLGGEGRIEKGEKFHLFGGREGEENFLSKGLTGYCFYAVCTANRYVFLLWYLCSSSKIGALSASV